MTRAEREAQREIAGEKLRKRWAEDLEKIRTEGCLKLLGKNNTTPPSEKGSLIFSILLMIDEIKERKCQPAEELINILQEKGFSRTRAIEVLMYASFMGWLPKKVIVPPLK